MLPDFPTAYRQGALADFFELPPGDVDGALALERPGAPQQLVEALQRHARRLRAPQPVLDNIARLAKPGARTVVTGQQTGLLLGPTYTLSKAMTAVRLAAELDSAERPVIPVFWLASQDHDVDEVDHAYLLDSSETLRRIRVALPAGVASGRSAFHPDMLTAVSDSLATHSPRPRYEADVMASLTAAAAVSTTYADWFAAQLYQLLGATGVVLLDPLEPEIAELFGPVLERELDDPGTGPAAINEAGERLRDLGLKPQLGRGADATNLFIELDDGSNRYSRRALLRATAKGFVAEGQTFSRAELRARLAADPTALTPAAGLRPITQDHLLPTSVFVVGPGELAYVAQLGGVYRQHDVPMPLVWPRATAGVLEPAAARLLDGWNVSAQKFQSDPAGLLDEILLARHGHAVAFGKATGELARTFEALLEEVDGIDPTLAGTVNRGRGYLEATLERLRGKTSAALARRDSDSKRQFERLQAHLLPLGQPAERILSPYSHILKFGSTALIDRFAGLKPTGAQELRL